MTSRFQFRRADALAWTTANPTLAAGEFGYELDTGKFKIGTGSTAWNSLVYSIPEASSGLSGATTPLVYDSEEQTVALNYGTGLTVSSGLLVPDFGSASGKVAEGNHVHAVTPVSYSASMTVFTKVGLVRKREYEAKWNANRGYKILSVTADVGKHVQNSHPDDGCPTGTAIKLNLRKYDAGYENDTGSYYDLFKNGSELQIAANSHKGSYTLVTNDSNVNWSTLSAGETMTLNVTQVGSTYPGRNLTINIFFETV